MSSLTGTDAKMHVRGAGAKWPDSLADKLLPCRGICARGGEHEDASGGQFTLQRVVIEGEGKRLSINAKLCGKCKCVYWTADADVPMAYWTPDKNIRGEAEPPA